MYTLIVVLWLSPVGYVTEGESGLTLQECQDRAFYSKGRSRCILE